MTCLEDLHILDALLLAATKIDGHPFVDNVLDVTELQTRERQVMARMEAQHVAATSHRLGL